MKEYSKAQKIKRGIKMLNVIYPGWQDKIDLCSLNIDSFGSCILGQLYGNYDNGRYRVDEYSLDYHESERTQDYGLSSYCDTTNEWLNYLRGWKKRKKSAKLKKAKT